MSPRMTEKDDAQARARRALSAWRALLRWHDDHPADRDHVIAVLAETANASRALSQLRADRLATAAPHKKRARDRARRRRLMFNALVRSTWQWAKTRTASDERAAAEALASAARHSRNKGVVARAGDVSHWRGRLRVEGAKTADTQKATLALLERLLRIGRATLAPRDPL